jgi:lysophospholipase L1-like esterase
MSEPVLTPSKRVLFALISLMLSSALSFAILEAVARVLEKRPRPRRATTRLAILRENPAGTGSYRLQPKLDLVAEVKGERIPIRTNRFGMRWREVTVPKPTGRTRVAFLGDSFTFGCWAPIEETFVGAFERRQGEERVEALNFGVGGYGLDDMELILKEEAARFAPDVVLVMFFDGNDMRDTYLGVHKYDLVDGSVELNAENFALKAPGYTREDEPFALQSAPDPSAVRRALARFASFRLLLPILALDNPWLQFRPSRYFTSFTYWSQYPYPPEANRARVETLLTLGRMRAFADSIGARIAVVAIPSREQVYSVAERGPYFDIRLPQAFVETYARDNGIAYFDLLPPLRARALATGAHLYLPSDIHFDRHGHRLVAEILSEWFARTLRPSVPVSQ